MLGALQKLRAEYVFADSATQLLNVSAKVSKVFQEKLLAFEKGLSSTPGDDDDASLLVFLVPLEKEVSPPLSSDDAVKNTTQLTFVWSGQVTRIVKTGTYPRFLKSDVYEEYVSEEYGRACQVASKQAAEAKQAARAKQAAKSDALGADRSVITQKLERSSYIIRNELAAAMALQSHYRGWASREGASRSAGAQKLQAVWRGKAVRSGALGTATQMTINASNTPIAAVRRFSVMMGAAITGDDSAANNKRRWSTIGNGNRDSSCTAQQNVTGSSPHYLSRLASEKNGPSPLAVAISQALPEQLQLSVAVLKTAAKVGHIEATRDTRMLNKRANVRMMATTVRPWYIVHPSWTAVQRWEFVMAVCMIFVSTATPFEVMVMRHPASTPLRALNRLVDAMFLGDMILHFFLCYNDKAFNNQPVYDLRRIGSRYSSTWFALDFVSIFPFTEVASSYPQLAALRVVRLVRLVKLSKLARIVRMGDALSLSSGYITLCKFSFLMCLVTQVVACTYCLIAQLEEFDGYPSWLTIGEEEGRIEVSGSASRYLHAIEFAIFAMVLTYPRALSCTILEQGFAISMLVVMGCFYAYVIGLICGIISKMDPAGTDFANKKDLVKAWTDECNMPEQLREDLARYTEECRVIIRQRYYRTVLDMLSPRLRGQVSQFLYGDWFRAIPFFQCDDERESTSFTMAIAERLVMLVFSPSETIVSSFEDADRMYIIAKGVVAKSNSMVMCQGRYFGEEMLMRRGSHTCSHMSVTFVTLHQLLKTELDAALGKGCFPRTLHSIRRWIAHKAFVHTMKAIVTTRRAAPNYHPLTAEQVRLESEKLIRIGRDGLAAANNLKEEKERERLLQFRKASPAGNDHPSHRSDIAHIIKDLHKRSATLGRAPRIDVDEEVRSSPCSSAHAGGEESVMAMHASGVVSHRGEDMDYFVVRLCQRTPTTCLSYRGFSFSRGYSSDSAFSPLRSGYRSSRSVQSTRRSHISLIR